jgi:redox-sensing transcriptional repressor
MEKVKISAAPSIDRLLLYPRVIRTSQNAIIAGVGNLGSALIGCEALQTNGLSIVAGFDIHPEKIGSTIRGTPIFDIATAAITIPLLGVKIAILTTPGVCAQDTADILIDGGISVLWNFTKARLKAPSHVLVQDEDFSSGYDMLCVKMLAKQSLFEAGSRDLINEILGC